jgi:hypothetical protein
MPHHLPRSHTSILRHPSVGATRDRTCELAPGGFVRRGSVAGWGLEPMDDSTPVTSLRSAHRCLQPENQAMPANHELTRATNGRQWQACSLRFRGREPIRARFCQVAPGVRTGRVQLSGGSRDGQSQQGAYLLLKRHHCSQDIACKPNTCG